MQRMPRRSIGSSMPLHNPQDSLESKIESADSGIKILSTGFARFSNSLISRLVIKDAAADPVSDISCYAKIFTWRKAKLFTCIEVIASLSLRMRGKENCHSTIILQNKCVPKKRLALTILL